MGAGMLLSTGAWWQLGWTGTYLGDYFGILMTQRVTAFPFNVFDNPMYVGSVMSTAGHAVVAQSATGLALTGALIAMYYVALLFEEPFTAMIYEEAAKKAKKAKKASKKASKKDK